MTLGKQFRAIAVLIWFDGLLPIRRSPFNLVNFVVSPLTILFFIYLFAGPQKAVFAISGGLTAVIVGSCIILETEAAFIRLVVRLQDMFVSSPLSPVSYVLGLSIALLLNGLAGIVLFSVLLAVSVNINALGWLDITLACILTWAAVSTLGFVLSTFARDMRDLWVYAPLLTVVLSFLPPIFYPITVIPASLRWVAFVSPTTYPAQIIQMSSGLIPYSQSGLAFDLIGGAVYILLLLLLAARLARWRQR
jgi:ABC-2 type transport system permease protein